MQVVVQKLGVGPDRTSVHYVVLVPRELLQPDTQLVRISTLLSEVIVTATHTAGIGTHSPALGQPSLASALLACHPSYSSLARVLAGQGW